MIGSNNADLTFAAIMAAEERRKQKEQIKILKQQVGLPFFFTCLVTNLNPYLPLN